MDPPQAQVNRKSSSTTTTTKSARDPFHLEGDLRNINSSSSSKGKSVATKRPSSSGGRGSSSTAQQGVFGDHAMAKPFINDEPKIWPAGLKKVFKNGIYVLENNSGQTTHVLMSGTLKGKKTSSAREYLKKLWLRSSNK